MKLSDRFKYAYRILRGSSSYRPPPDGRHPLHVRQMPFSLPIWSRRNEVPPLINYEAYAREGYQQNAVVFSCIDKIATTAPSANLIIERDVDGKREPVTDHFLLRTFQNPNPHMSAYTFKELLHTYLNIAGEAFVIKVGFGGRPGGQTKPGELYLPRPDYMRPIPGDKQLLGFVYCGSDGRRTPFSPKEVIHIKRINPFDMLEGFGRGLPPMSAAAYAIDADNKMTMLIRDFFDGGAIVSGLLKIKHTIVDDDEIVRLRNRLKQQYTGDKHFFDMILDADAEYQRIGMSFDEMALPNLRNLSESRICAVFGVPPLLVGVQVGLKNEAGFTTAMPEARKHLWMDKIQPDNTRIAEALTLGLASQLEEDEFIEWDYGRIGALQENRTEAFKRATEAWLGDLITRNEGRREIGFPAMNDGEVFHSQFKNQFAPTGSSALPLVEEDGNEQ